MEEREKVFCDKLEILIGTLIFEDIFNKSTNNYKTFLIDLSFVYKSLKIGVTIRCLEHAIRVKNTQIKNTLILGI